MNQEFFRYTRYIQVYFFFWGGEVVGTSHPTAGPEVEEICEKSMVLDTRKRGSEIVSGSLKGFYDLVSLGRLFSTNVD